MARTAAPKRKDKVAHIRFAPDEFSAVAEAAGAAGMTISAFVRSLSMEGAGVRPVFTKEDHALLRLLAEGMRAIGGNLNQIARALNTGKMPSEKVVAGSIQDVHSVATTLACTLADLTRRAAAARRREGA